MIKAMVMRSSFMICVVLFSSILLPMQQSSRGAVVDVINNLKEVELERHNCFKKPDRLHQRGVSCMALGFVCTMFGIKLISEATVQSIIHRFETPLVTIKDLFGFGSLLVGSGLLDLAQNSFSERNRHAHEALNEPVMSSMVEQYRTSLMDLHHENLGEHEKGIVACLRDDHELVSNSLYVGNQNLNEAMQSVVLSKLGKNLKHYRTSQSQEAYRTIKSQQTPQDHLDSQV